MRLAALLLILCVAICGPACAHEVRPVYLEVVERGADQFDIVLKRPSAGAGVLSVAPAFPAACEALDRVASEETPGALITRWRIRCVGGLEGEIALSGLDQTLTSAFVRVRWMNGRTLEAVLTGGRASLALDAAIAPAAWSYIGLGIEHILLGFDHLAFVACLVLIVSGWRKLLITLTAFTLAHSLTLGASALGFFGLPARPVETVIAFSIAVAAREALLVSRGEPGFAARAPWIIASGFGLLHGFGFAGALAQIGLPQDAKIAALLAFNVGVELGQILALAAFLGALWGMRIAWPQRAALVQGAGSLALGGLAMFWLFERLIA